jgi:hypothetical protein
MVFSDGLILRIIIRKFVYILEFSTTITVYSITVRLVLQEYHKVGSYLKPNKSSVVWIQKKHR